MGVDDNKASSGPWDWAEVPRICAEDGWRQVDGKEQVDGRCRIDPRFARPGAWAVRRLGGPAIAERLVEAVGNKHPATEEFCDGNLLVEGILFEYSFNPRGQAITIRDAELVEPGPRHPPALVSFFADLWRARASHASLVASRFTGLTENDHLDDRPSSTPSDP